MMNKFYIATLLTMLLSIVSCSSKKTVIGDYYIHRLEEGKPYLYYLIKEGEEDSLGGVFDGVVSEIGIKNNEIYAKVERLSSSDESGWYKVNVDNGKIYGPLDFETECKGISVSLIEDYFKK